MLRKKTITVITALIIAVIVQAQVPLLEKLVTLHADNKRTAWVMDELEKQGAFTFSYASGLIDSARPVTVHAVQRPLREVLRMVFGYTLDFKERGNHIILVRMRLSNGKQIIEGYVSRDDGSPLSAATVFDRQSLVTAHTNEYGYYRMRVPAAMEPLQLQVSKANYRDTLMPVNTDSSVFRHFTITKRDPLKLEALGALVDSGGKRLRDLGDLLWPEKLELKNVDDTLYRDVQFSFVPFVGSNGPLSGSVVNKWSLNLLGGYSFGTTRAEAGGLFNINRGDVQYAQLAGLFNANGGRTTGFQAAGFFNSNFGSMQGCQLAGFTNFNRQSSSGIIASGFANVLGDSARGCVLAGFSNVAARSSQGFMASGFANVVAGTFNGAMLSGFANVTAGDVNGMQVSGFANVARNVKGSQFGVFNLCDSISGAPVGLFSFVRKGYHILEIASDDRFGANLAVHSGVRGFYNIVTAGIRPGEIADNGIRHMTWTYGYGLGTSPRIARFAFLHLALTSNYIAQRSLIQSGEVTLEQPPFSAFNLDNKLTVTPEIRLAKHFAISGGPVLHALITERDVLYPDFFAAGTPRFIEQGNWKQYNLKMWLGWKVGIHLF